jgi:DNA repair protein RecO (recombination protein O)
MEIKLTGVIIAKKDVGEADRLYTFYTLEKGKIQALAKGVRKVQARLAGSLENFNLVSFNVVGKGTVKKITNAIVEDNFLSLRNNLDALRLIFRSIRILNQLVDKEEKDENIFNLLAEYLQSVESASINSSDKIELISQGFLFKLLDNLGYRFEVMKCTQCGGSIGSEKNYFSSQKGGMVCDNCSGTLKESMLIQTNSIKAIRIIYYNKIGSLLKLKVGKKELDDLRKITDNFLQWIAK